MKASFPRSLVLKWDNLRNTFVVYKEFSVFVDGKEYKVDEGFTTDLASIPRWATPLVPKLGHHLQPAVFHDWCYENGVPGMKRVEADRIFLNGMLIQGVRKTRAWLMYGAVRVGGKGLFG